MARGPTLQEIADRIREHLQRFENDPAINTPVTEGGSTRRYYNAYAYPSGRYVTVRYVSYQGDNHLTKDQAIAYLAWLDAGNVGKHFTLMEKAR